MAALTSQQAKDLSDNFLALAQVVTDFRFRNWGTLSKADKDRLGESQRSILKYGEDILALSTVLVMDEVQASLTKINTVTTEIKSTMATLKNVQKGLNVAACLVTLGAGIISKNPQTIGDAISGLVSTWKAKAT